jgi:hypothetical protein
MECGHWQADKLTWRVRRRQALVIGCDAYPGAYKLAGCVNDANSMAAVLKRLRFECTVLINPTLTELTAAADDFLHSLREHDLTFTFYAGHGCEVDGVLQLQTVDGAAYRLTLLMDRMDGQNLVNVLVLDCCRTASVDVNANGSRSLTIVSSSSFRSISKNSVQLPSRGYFFIAFANASGQCATEHEGQGDVTRSLLPLLDQEDVPFRRVLVQANKELRRMQLERNPHLDKLQIIEVKYTVVEEIDELALNAMSHREFYAAPSAAVSHSVTVDAGAAASASVVGPNAVDTLNLELRQLTTRSACIGRKG